MVGGVINKVTDLEKYKKEKATKKLIYQLVLSGHKSQAEFDRMYPPDLPDGPNERTDKNGKN